MAHPVLSDDEARTFFVTLQQSPFNWTVAELPALLAELGWTIDDSATVPGRAAIADVAWDLPGADVTMTFTGGNVDRFIVTLASPADTPAEQLEIADAFARYVNIAQDVFGAPGTRFPGDYPALRWRLKDTVFTMTNLVSTISVSWATADLQDALDRMDSA